MAATTAAPLRGVIEVAGLTFSHQGSEPILQDLAFRVEAGQTLALLGPPGAGKSTFVHLLLRLYDYERGSIRLDGRELATLDRGFVRSAIGVVLQEPFLYSKTIAANVKVGRADATPEQIVESAAAACIHEAVAGFPSGYETLIGERGVTLSGGQRQRLAIARALLKDPAILVLDDALSAVDTETEARILDALRRRSGRRTTILIAHRLSSVLHADRILVLDKGRIVQSGTHAELAEAVGPYRRLWQIQADVEEEMIADLGAAQEDGR
jgi:ATP-binding cassette subfamily B protein